MRAMFALGACLWTVSLFAAQNDATDFPNRPVRLVVPFAPGGFTDVVARITAQRLFEAWGTPVVVDNRPGAAGTIGPAIAVQANPDGYTLLFGSNSTFSVNPAVYRKLPYDVSRDLQLVGLTAFSPHALIVRAGIEAKTVPELLALARKQPGKLTFASSGTGAVVHMAGELFKHRTGIDIVHVPFKGGGPAATAMLSGEVDLMVNDAGPVVPHIKSGRLRALAVANDKRTSLLPGVPTLAEVGVQGVESSSWAGVAVGTKTPRAIVQRINSVLTRAVNSPDYKDRLAALGMEPMLMSQAEASAFITQELAKWTMVAKIARVQLE